jgi:DNA-binding PucR family transcriptional regulator
MIMLNKLQSLFPNAILFSVPPQNSLEKYFVFFDRSHEEWIGIPRGDISEKELNILKTFLELEELHSSVTSPLTKCWHEFLFSNGQLPPYHEENIRFIQFRINGNVVDQSEIDIALKGFFSNDILIVWESGQNGVVIENHNLMPLSEKELISMTETFESDFYIHITFYIGKQHPCTDRLPIHFRDEREYFIFGLKHLAPLKIFTFERVFPSYLAFSLPDTIKGKVNEALSEVFAEDSEMFATLMVYLENNLNASLTAKKLYIHRNTLQYRIDKFTEKTGIQLKDFHGAFTVFLACLIFEQGIHK